MCEFKSWPFRKGHPLLRIALAWLVCFTFNAREAYTQSEGEKARVIVLTDITNEPDDEQSLIRFLLYSNEYDVEGMLASTSTWRKDSVHPEKIVERIEAYGRVRDNLLQHATGFPPKEQLLNLTKACQPYYGMAGVGSGKGSPGADLIISVVDKSDPRPVWISIWGGANCLAQALWEVQQTRSAAEVASFVSKLRVYEIGGQDDAGAWICHTFSDVFWARSVQQFQAISVRERNPFPPEVTGANIETFTPDWVDEHVQRHGPLGALYPDAVFKHEGDTPAFLHLIPNGLSKPEQLHLGTWGGRFTVDREANPKGMARVTRDQATFHDFSMYVDASDTWTYQGITYANSVHAALFRWREAFQHDFAARMDWSVADAYDKANHNPIAGFDHDTSREPVILQVKGGETVFLSAEGSFDPDGDALTYRWFYYPEPGTYAGTIQINRPASKHASITAPTVSDPTVLHLILEVRDTGEPALFSYRRILVHVGI